MCRGGPWIESLVDRIRNWLRGGGHGRRGELYQRLGHC